MKNTTLYKIGACTSMLLMLTFQLIIGGGCLTATSSEPTFVVGEDENGIFIDLKVDKSDSSSDPAVVCKVSMCLFGDLEIERSPGQTECLDAGANTLNVSYWPENPKVGKHYNIRADGLEGDSAEAGYVCYQPQNRTVVFVEKKKYPRTPKGDNGGDAGRPAAPTNLLVNAASQSIDLSWTDNSDNETSFRIERDVTGSGNFTNLTQVSANVTTYSDSNISPDVVYQYRVIALNSQGESTPTEAGSGSVSAPATPGNFTAQAVGSLRINLTWSYFSWDETGFVIERSLTSGANFTQIATIAAGMTTYEDTSVQGGTTYYYRVKAIRGAINSNYSVEASDTANP